MTKRHIVLTKPGDLLIIGNVGSLRNGHDDAFKHVREFFNDLGIRVAVFTEDIDIERLPEGNA